jgi:hypothetical protein
MDLFRFLLPGAHQAKPDSDEDVILKHPSLEEVKEKLKAGIENETFLDLDPGVFDGELVKLGIYSKVDQDNPSKEATYQNGNIKTGTYEGTQAAVTHLYRRIERT